MDALHKLENEVMQLTCDENVAYILKRMCCTHLKSDSKPQAMFSADPLEVKAAGYIAHIMLFSDF